MKLPQALVDELRVDPGDRAGIEHRATGRTHTAWLSGGADASPGELAEQELSSFKTELADAQQLLYANGTRALLLIFQALDAAGKDGTIKHVMSGVNPQGCRVVGFRQPSQRELRHDFLWRCVLELPERGEIGIFNRSYYEEVLVVRVHPELLAAQHVATSGHHDAVWRDRFDDINAFEHHLDRCGTRVVKFFLHVSKEEQRKRFLARLDDPAKRWKFAIGDLAEREHFDEYQHAYEAALTETSTSWAPWYVIPADHKPTMRALVAGIVVHEIERLGLASPTVDAADEPALEQARRELVAEGTRAEP
jgi:PPK2 family polyphosphate:nucleotide phosphotransferase